MIRYINQWRLTQLYGMMEAGWSARRLAHQLGRSGCVPARSPDLSPIEHIWEHFGRRVGHPTTLNELEARLEQIWNEMSQDIIQIVYSSMPQRITSCIRARESSTGY
ncbi:transposable element Tcb1 transposase [Trichonephila clavipes]|nr:transposable element Tcb1 transposase [Trichonephila clavipes]